MSAILTLPGDWLTAGLLATSRSAGWVALAPPFATRAVPGVAKAALALGFAVPVIPHVLAHPVPQTTPDLLIAVTVQVVTGLALGFVAMLLFAAVAAAGNLIDLFGGFTLSTAYDPLELSQSSAFGRLHAQLATALLLASGGHLLLLRGFVESYDAAPRGRPVGALASLLATDFSRFFVGALEIAAPLAVALFLADLGLGLLSRAAPALNVFSLAFPLKVLLTLLLGVGALPLVPGAVDTITGFALRAVHDVASALPG